MSHHSSIPQVYFSHFSPPHRVYLNCSDDMAQLHVFNDTEKLGEIQKMEKLAKYNDKHLFNHKVMMDNSLIIVISLT